MLTKVLFWRDFAIRLFDSHEKREEALPESPFCIDISCINTTAWTDTL